MVHPAVTAGSFSPLKLHVMMIVERFMAHV